MADTRRPSDRLSSIEDQLRGMHGAMAELVRLGERQANLLDHFTRLESTSAARHDDHEKRLREIEKHLPQLNEARRWLVSAASAAVAAVGASLLTFSVKGHAAPIPPKEPPPVIAPRTADEPKTRPAPHTD